MAIAGFALAVVGIGFGLLWLSIYSFGVYSLGKHLARWLRLRIPLSLAMAGIVVVTLGLALPLLFLYDHAIMRLTYFFCLWLLNGSSLAFGYHFEAERLRSRDLRNWTENVNNWVEEWESDQAPTWLRDIEDKGN